MTAAGVVSALLVIAVGAAVRAAVVAGRRGRAVRRFPAAGNHWGVERAAPAARRICGPPPRWLEGALVAAGHDVDPSLVWVLWCGGVVVAVPVCVLAGGPLVGATGTLAVLGGPPAVLWGRRGQGDARIERALPVALEAVARALRSGASMRQAVEETAPVTPGPLGAEIAWVASQASRGAPLVTALEGLAERRPLPGVRLAVAALCLAVETGGAQARAVDGVASTLRDRLGVADEVRALAAQARLSAVVIGLAPIGFGAFAAATDPRTSQFVFHTGAGLALVCAGLVLDGVGWLWMNRLCRVTA